MVGEPFHFFFAAFPNLFFIVHLDNRFRLAGLGGVEPLRKLLNPKLCWAEAFSALPKLGQRQLDQRRL